MALVPTKRVSNSSLCSVKNFSLAATPPGIAGGKRECKRALVAISAAKPMATVTTREENERVPPSCSGPASSVAATRLWTFTRAAMPGSSSSINSSDAPPPVEMKVILSASPACFTAVTESPPPMIVVAFERASASAIAIVPVANAGISKTPTGPFHKIVFAFAISSS